MRASLPILAVLVVTPSVAPTAARADRYFVDVEPVAIHASADDHQLASMFVVSAGRRAEVGGVTGFAAVGAGLLSVSARAGALVPLGHAWVARVELRPQLAIICAEPAVLGGVGLGYRVARDGAPVTVIAAVESGPGWAHTSCGPDRMLGPTERTWFTGGALSIAVGL